MLLVREPLLRVLSIQLIRKKWCQESYQIVESQGIIAEKQTSITKDFGSHLSSHTFVIAFPLASISSANTPTIPFKKDSCPLEDVFKLKNMEP